VGPEGNELEDEPLDHPSTIVKLSQLTRETANHSNSSEESLSSNDDGEASSGVPLKATRNGILIHSQLIRRRKSSTATVNNHQGASGLVKGTNDVVGGKVGKASPPETSTPPSGSKTTKKAAYQTFDFSILKDHKSSAFLNSPEEFTFYPRPATKKQSRSINGGGGPQKIGGGGIVARKKVRGHYHRRSNKLGVGATSDTETESPCLTIIDFNLLIRKGLEGIRIANGQKSNFAQRGWSSRRRILRDKIVGVNFAGGGSNIGGSGNSLSFNNVRVSGGALGRGESPTGQQTRTKRRQNAVRRRRAILLRGAVTDCSPWEDQDDDSSSDSDTSNLSLPQNLPNLRHHLNKSLEAPGAESKGDAGSGEDPTSSTSRALRRRRTKSPATPTLSPSPIFLPQ
jgi:hypothetical protein